MKPYLSRTVNECDGKKLRGESRYLQFTYTMYLHFACSCNIHKEKGISLNCFHLVQSTYYVALINTSKGKFVNKLPNKSDRAVLVDVIRPLIPLVLNRCL